KLIFDEVLSDFSYRESSKIVLQVLGTGRSLADGNRNSNFSVPSCTNYHSNMMARFDKLDLIPDVVKESLTRSFMDVDHLVEWMADSLSTEEPGVYSAEAPHPRFVDYKTNRWVKNCQENRRTVILERQKA
uniref:Snurportin-1 N-terminal domain-containing protein n=1 Tax=Romanomermis culicivorax TaxID=13658 RepID=A0A915HPT1_ROMCU